MTAATKKLLKKPVRLSLARQVLQAMEELIRQGHWAVGDRIPAEPELVAEFGVSRNTVREAVQSLIHAGILEARPGDGTYVLASDRFEVAMNSRLRGAELSKILEARLALEKEIARLAALNRTADDLRRLEEAWAKCGERIAGSIEPDMNFHAQVAAATGNPVLAELYHVIVKYLQDNLSLLLAEKQFDPAAMQLHAELLEAIRRRDPDLAEAIVSRIVEFDTRSIAPAID